MIEPGGLKKILRFLGSSLRNLHRDTGNFVLRIFFWYHGFIFKTKVMAVLICHMLLHHIPLSIMEMLLFCENILDLSS